MSGKKKFGYIVITAIVIGLLLFVIEKKNRVPDSDYRDEEKNTEQKITYPKTNQSHKVVFEDREVFLKSVADYPSEVKLNPEIKGGIVPHHLLPGFIIADFFSRLSEKEIETIVLVGPNHYERGNFGVITSEYNWDTPFGILEPDNEIISNLKEKQLAKTEEIISLDHSITGILPFIKYYLPKVKVVPLILKSDLSEEATDNLALELQGCIKDKKVAMVASVDFSHYLTNLEAKEKNIESLEAIEKRSYDKIFSFGDDHMDSPASVALVLKTMDLINAKEMRILHDTNSGEMLEDNISKITSYLSLSFSVKK